MPDPTPAALPFAVENGAKATQYGALFWIAGLTDGREVRIHADRMFTLDGALVFVQDTKLAPLSPSGKTRVDLDTPVTTLILAPGQWTHGYAASGLDGAPVAVDSLDAPKAAA